MSGDSAVVAVTWLPCTLVGVTGSGFRRGKRVGLCANQDILSVKETPDHVLSGGQLVIAGQHLLEFGRELVDFSLRLFDGGLGFRARCVHGLNLARHVLQTQYVSCMMWT